MIVLPKYFIGERKEGNGSILHLPTYYFLFEIVFGGFAEKTSCDSAVAGGRLLFEKANPVSDFRGRLGLLTTY